MRRLSAFLALLVAASVMVVGGETASASVKSCGDPFTDYSGDGSMKTVTKICVYSTEDGQTGGGTLDIDCYHKGFLGFWNERFCRAFGKFVVKKGDYDGTTIAEGQFHGQGWGDIYVYQPFSFRCQGAGKHYLGMRETRVNLHEVYSDHSIGSQPYAGMYIRNANGAAVNVSYCINS